MKSKILYIIMLVITIIGVIIIGTNGFKFDLSYRKTKMVEIYLGKEFELNDIRSIINEVIPEKEVKLNKIGEFENTVSITLDSITDEELDLLNKKINEKYELENKKEDILSVDLANIRLKDIVKPYIIPTLIFTIITLLYFMIIFKKVGFINIFVKFILNVVLPESAIIAILAILRIPVAGYLMALILTIYSVLLIAQSNNLKIKLDKIKLEENKK